MVIRCAYCELSFRDFLAYKFHLKIHHNKRTYNDKLICGQNGCPLDFNRFRSLCQHIMKTHQNPLTCSASIPSNELAFDNIEATTDCDVPDVEPATEQSSEMSPVEMLSESLDENGILHEAALFTAKLRSNPKIPLSVVNDIVQSCTEFLTPVVRAVKQEVHSVLEDYSVPEGRSASLLQMLDVIEKPFEGLDTTWKQTKYLRQKGFYVESRAFTIDSCLIPFTDDQGLPSYRVKRVTGEYVSQKALFEKILSLPGVVKCVIEHMSQEDGMISDFRDGLLWKNHPLRNRYRNCKDVIVILVFDFYDDLETANPLGSHAVIHKVGMKYTVVKAFKPMYNSKLENILLNMVIDSSERATSDVFDIYLDEMSELENKGFQLNVDGQQYTVFIVMVQVIGDNLGLNSMLGYVESFTANYPCRLCKLPRERFGHCLNRNACYVHGSHTIMFHNKMLLKLALSYSALTINYHPSMPVRMFSVI